MSDTRWIPWSEVPASALVGEWGEIDLGCRYIGPEREQWGLNDFQAVNVALAGALCAAHRLDYLPSGLCPFHYPLEVL